MDAEDVAGFLAGLVILLCILAIPASAIYSNYQGAGIEARLYNAKFNTSYVARDFFFAGESIKAIHAEKVPERPATNNINATLELK